MPDGDGWKVSATSGTAHVNLSVQCYAGGFISVDQDVFFTMVADVEVQDDGGVHITIDRQGDPPPIRTSALSRSRARLVGSTS